MQQKVQQKLQQLQGPRPIRPEPMRQEPMRQEPMQPTPMQIYQKPPEPIEPIEPFYNANNNANNANNSANNSANISANISQNHLQPLPESLLDIFPDLDNGERKIAKQNELTAQALANEKINKLLDDRIGSSNKQSNKQNDKQDPSIQTMIENDISILLPGKKKQQVKKTIRRKYTVGRNIKTNTVGILIKDHNTRKKIINAQKEMKKKPMNELKKDLKEHNLIKVGSSAPNDVLRATYEYAKLAGDIVNTNSEMLLHNFVNGSNDSS
jgi:hypothetical protein